MMKRKGVNAERELLHLFWQTGEWTACRVAGSGSMKYPSPDIIAHRDGLGFAVECKATKSKYQYFTKEEIVALRRYARMSGIRALVAVKFSRLPWVFLDPAELKETGRNFVVSRELAELRGLAFKDLTKSL